jgi:virginiamycin B lyase
LASAAVVVLAAATAAPAAAAPAVSGEFAVSELNSNNKLVQGPDGNMWVTLGGAKDVAKVTPEGVVTEYDLGIEGAGGIAVSPTNEIWITRNGGVTQFQPGDPEGTKVSTLVEPIASGPIVLGPDGNFWAAGNEKLVRISAADAKTQKAFTIAGLNPRDLDVAGGLLAIADFNNRILTATFADPPATTEYKLTGGSQGVAGNAAGQVGFSQQGAAPTQIGLLTPPAEPLLVDVPGTDPFGVALGPDAAFWTAQFATDTASRLGTDGVLTALSPGFAAGSGPRQIAAGPGNTLWVTLETAKKVGRISGVEVEAPTPTPAIPEPRTQLKAGPKGTVKTRKKTARVRFKFRSPDAGATFQCRLKRLPAKKKAKTSKASKQSRWGGCKSPRRYRLKPGRYRFEVRAVLAGVTDKTPAERSFRVVRVSGK